MDKRLLLMYIVYMMRLDLNDMDYIFDSCRVVLDYVALGIVEDYSRLLLDQYEQYCDELRASANG